MKIVVAAIAGLGLASAAFAAPKLGEYQPQRAPEEVYAKVCGYCHGRNIGPILFGRNLPTDMVKAVARQGRNGMPAFRPTEVTNAELDALATWISKAPARVEEHGK